MSQLSVHTRFCKLHQIAVISLVFFFLCVCVCGTSAVILDLQFLPCSK